MENMKQKIDRVASTFRENLLSFGRKIIPITDLREIAYAKKHQLESHLQMHGDWFTEHFRAGSLLSADAQGSNLFTTEGMNFILDEVFNAGGACTGNLYVGLFNANVTPAAGDTAAVKLSYTDGTYSELTPTTEMDEAARQEYVAAAASSANVTNTANKAVFTMADSFTVYGGFICTGSDPSSDSGALINAKAFTASRAVVADDVLNILVSLTMTSS